MKELSLEEFKVVMRRCMDEEYSYSDQGSSRAVFEVNYGDKWYVAKFAGDKQGRLQNRIELEAYEDYGDEYYLCPIVAHFEDVLLVCEYVTTIEIDVVEKADTCELEEFKEYMEEWNEYYSKEYNLEDLYESIREVVCSISTIQGDTSDNYQLGFGYKGCGLYNIVCYDYGYDTINYENCDVVGNMEEYINWGNIRLSPLWTLIAEYLDLWDMEGLEEDEDEDEELDDGE